MRFHVSSTLNRILFLFVALMLACCQSWAGSFKTLYRFKKSNDAASPTSGLVFDHSGNLFGATTYGGKSGNGAIYKLTPNGDGTWSESVLYSFTGGSDGENPSSGLIFDRDGNLYGSTYYGGDNGYGVVFELSPQGGTWTETVLHSFTGGSDGAISADLIFDQAGNLYGAAAYGGDHNGQSGHGVVFELSPGRGGWVETVLYTFKNGPDGSLPWSPLVFDQAGNLYGVTGYGGRDSDGVAYQLSPTKNGEWTETVLHYFTGNSGGFGFGSLVFDSVGNLYGTSQLGGSHSHGLVFELTQDSWNFSVIYNFPTAKRGDRPISIILDSLGNIYGMTDMGGSIDRCSNLGPGCGVLFMLTKAGGTWTETTLHRFYNRPGAYPTGSLILDSTGNLYGATVGDLKTTWGSVFEFTP